MYLPGLSSTLSFASLSVKPAFLSLVETYLVTLDPSALRPALKAIILCLLPGLEEESSEDFERTLRLLNEFRRVVRVGKDMEDVTGDQYFWQCLFLASITSPSKRPGALAYLIQFLPKLANSTSPRAITNGHRSLGPEGNQLSPAIENVLSPEPGLLIRCFAAGLGDDQLLIQRGFLDLLVTNLPLHSAVLQDRVTAEDLERLVVAAVGVVARRDMSLNRRLWTWLLGPDRPPSEEDSTPSSPSSPSSEISAKPSDKSVHHQTRYFSQYGLRPLVDSVRSMIDKKSSTPAERVRPFRICLSLMDRWEVGGLVIPNVFLPMVESLRQFETHAESREAFNEVLKSGKIFFDGVESGLIWGEILGQLTAALGESNIGTKDGGQSLALVKFMVTQFNLRDEEMLVVHIPTVTLALLSMLEITTAGESGHSKASHTENARVIASALGIAQQLIDMIPERVFVTNEMTQSSVPPSRHDHSLQSREIIDNITKFYDEVHGNIESSDPPFSTYDIGGLLLNGIVLLLTRGFQRSFHVSTLEACVSLLNSLLRKVPYSGKLYNDQLVSAFQQSLKPSPVLSQTGLPFPALSAIVSCLYSLYQASSPNYCFSDEQASYLTPVLVRQLWSYLAPSNPKYHVEAVRCIRRLHTITKRDRLVEASITTLMVDESNDENNGLNSEASRSFAILWAHCVQLSDGVPNDTMIQNLKKVHESKARGSMEDDDDWLTRPVFLLLDALSDEGSEMFIFVRAWLQNLPSVTKYSLSCVGYWVWPDVRH